MELGLLVHELITVCHCQYFVPALPCDDESQRERDTLRVLVRKAPFCKRVAGRAQLFFRWEIPALRRCLLAIIRVSSQEDR